MEDQKNTPRERIAEPDVLYTTTEQEQADTVAVYAARRAEKIKAKRKCMGRKIAAYIAASAAAIAFKSLGWVIPPLAFTVAAVCLPAAFYYLGRLNEFDSHNNGNSC
jgi:hypothetical protein